MTGRVVPTPASLRRLLAAACALSIGGADAARGQGRAQARAQPAARRAVILTTDVGAEMDDQWTLAHLARSPELELRGVVTTHAPSLPAPAAERAAAVARDVFAHLPRGTPAAPVFAGSGVALERGAAGRGRPRANAGVSFLIDEARRHAAAQPRAKAPRRLAVLVTGAATDVASALLLAPDLADKIEVIAMAFDDRARGGDSWNVRNDVAAWQVLLASPVPLTIGDAAVTRRDLRMTRGRARALFAAPGVDSVAGRYLVDELVRWLERDPPFVRTVTGSVDAWIIWDEVVTAHLLGLTRVERRPRRALQDDLRFAAPAADAAAAGRTVTWVTGIDERRLWRHFVGALGR